MKYLEFVLSAVILIIVLSLNVNAIPPQTEIDIGLLSEGEITEFQNLMQDARAHGIEAPTDHPWREWRSGLDREIIRAIVILIDFEDNQADLENFPPSHFEDLLFSQGTHPTGSFTDYYLEVSYNEVEFQGEVVGYYRMPETYAYYVNGEMGSNWHSYPNNAQRMAEDAINAADPDVDFSQYDNDNDGIVEACFIVHAGPGAESTGSDDDIWSHKWVTRCTPRVDNVRVREYCTEPEDGTIGVFCHEAGHLVFGLVDLYDTTPRRRPDSRGIGDWSIMASGAWLNDGSTPAHPDAYSRILAGFITPEVPTVNLMSESIPQVETNQSIYRLWTNGVQESEYFLVENRQRVDFDSELPGDGLLIYHVDETQFETNNNDNPWYPGYTTSGNYLVALEQADGRWELEENCSADDGDPWPGTTDNRNFNNELRPNSQSYASEETDVAIENISNSQPTMIADLLVHAMEWTQTYGGSSSDRGLSVQQTSDGGYIVAGWTESYGAGGHDVYLIKTYASGNEQWSQTFGGSELDEGESVQQTSDGGYIIAGRTWSDYGSNWTDVYLIKTDASGNQQWSQIFGEYSFADGYSVQQTSDGGYIIAGRKSHPLGSHVYLIKTNASGTEQWSQTLGGSTYDWGFSVQQTVDGGYIIAGMTDSYGAGNYDVYLIKTDASGAEQWSQTFGGSGNDKGYSVQQTSDDGYIIAGSTGSYGAGNYDVYLIKTDASGNALWSQTFGGDDHDYGYSVQQTSDGGYIIGGETWSFNTWEPDVYLIKTDTSGIEQWSQTFGGSNYDMGYSVQQTSDDGYIIAGLTGSYGAGNYDVYLIKTAPETVVNHLFGVPPEHEILTAPSEFTLHGAYPNPFNPTTAISYQLAALSQVNLSVYDIAGRRVAELVNGWREAGQHEVTFDASNIASGMYFYQIQAGDFTAVKKMVLVK